MRERLNPRSPSHRAACWRGLHGAERRLAQPGCETRCNGGRRSDVGWTANLYTKRGDVRGVTQHRVDAVGHDHSTTCPSCMRILIHVTATCSRRYSGTRRGVTAWIAGDKARACHRVSGRRGKQSVSSRWQSSICCPLPGCTPYVTPLPTLGAWTRTGFPGRDVRAGKVPCKR